LTRISTAPGNRRFQPTESRGRDRKRFQPALDQGLRAAWIGSHVAAKTNGSARPLAMLDCAPNEFQDRRIERIGQRSELAGASVASGHVLAASLMRRRL
jgi:hypothetical protein